MSLEKQNKPHRSNNNRSNGMFIRPSAAQIVQMNKENPDKKVTNADFDPEVKLNHFGEPAFFQPQNTVQARMKTGAKNNGILPTMGLTTSSKLFIHGAGTKKYFNLTVYDWLIHHYKWY